MALTKRGAMIERELDRIEYRNRQITEQVESTGEAEGSAPCPSDCGGTVRWEQRRYQSGSFVREWLEIRCTTKGCIGNSGV